MYTTLEESTAEGGLEFNQLKYVSRQLCRETKELGLKLNQIQFTQTTKVRDDFDWAIPRIFEDDSRHSKSLVPPGVGTQGAYSTYL